jgi:Fic family protein
VSASRGFLQPLPPSVELETVAVLRALAAANRALAELKGRAATVPNQSILIDTLALQEAKASSEIENIVTTQDELFQLGLFPDGLESDAAKEVARYRDALKLGLTQLLDTGGLIRNATHRSDERQDGGGDLRASTGPQRDHHRNVITGSIHQ